MVILDIRAVSLKRKSRTCCIFHCCVFSYNVNLKGNDFVWWPFLNSTKVVLGYPFCVFYQSKAPWQLPGSLLAFPLCKLPNCAVAHFSKWLMGLRTANAAHFKRFKESDWCHCGYSLSLFLFFSLSVEHTLPHGISRNEPKNRPSVYWQGRHVLCIIFI